MTGANAIFQKVLSKRLKSRLKKIGVYSFLAYRTAQYKLHYYETATSVKFVMLTDTRSQDMQIALREIYVRCYVEYGTSACQSSAEGSMLNFSSSREKPAIPRRTSRRPRREQ